MCDLRFKISSKTPSPPSTVVVTTLVLFFSKKHTRFKNVCGFHNCGVYGAYINNNTNILCSVPATCEYVFTVFPINLFPRLLPAGRCLWRRKKLQISCSFMDTIRVRR